jgi:hypothetical protein
MSGSRNIIFAAAAAALIFAGSAVPCLADEVAGVANQSATEDVKAQEPVQEAVSKDVVSNNQEVVVATNDARNREPPPADFFLMPTRLPERPRARVTTSVVFQPSPPRVVAESQPSRICFWCGRQPVVLMLGVGY